MKCIEQFILDNKAQEGPCAEAQSLEQCTLER